MIFQIYILIFILTSCNSQEHFTCLRTDDVLSAYPHIPSTNQPGSPGKQGPIGAKGSIGQKGNKGDPGLPDYSMIVSLRNELMEVRHQLQNIAALTAAYYRGYKTLDDGWVALFNGYQYKTTSSLESWNDSRTICRNFGGDLAVYGVQNMGFRKILLEVFAKPPNRYWIGLNRSSPEGNWIWMDGVLAINETVFWAPGEPSNHKNSEHCGEMQGTGYQGRSMTNDIPCEFAITGLCEKVIVLK